MNAMQESELKPSSSYAIGDDIARAFARLSDRERLIGSLLSRANVQRGLPPIDGLDLVIRIHDCAPVLEEIPVWALSECFKLAVKVHDYHQPFQMGEVVMSWRTMSETTKEQLYGKQKQKALPPGPPCEWCAGSGFMRIREDGVSVKFVSLEETNQVVVCDCRRK